MENFIHYVVRAVINAYIFFVVAAAVLLLGTACYIGFLFMWSYSPILTILTGMCLAFTTVAIIRSRIKNSRKNVPTPEEVEERAKQDALCFEEYARDFNLSEEEIKEIENNEKFKARLYNMLRAVDPAEEKVRVWLCNYHPFMVGLEQSSFTENGNWTNTYGLSRELFYKLATNYPEPPDGVHWPERLVNMHANYLAFPVNQ